MATFFTFAMLLFADACREGAVAVQRRDLATAETLLKGCNTLEGYLLLAGIYQTRQDSEALYGIALKGLEQFPSERRFYLAVATHDARDKQYEKAVKVLEEGFRRWPEDPKVRSLLASSYFALGTEQLDSGKDETAVQSLTRAAGLAPDDLESQMNLGRALHNVLRYEEARKIFDKVIEQQPSFPLVRFHRGMALYALGEFESAIADLSGEIVSNPEYPPAHLMRGLSLLAIADWEKALKDLEVACVSMPSNPRAHYGRARALVQLGKLQAAEPVLRKVIELDPSDPAPVNTLVSVLVRLNKQKEAQTLAVKAAALARDRRTAARGEIRFEPKARQ